MTHLATPGPVLIGAIPPWTEEEHGDLRVGTLWLDTSGEPAVLHVLDEVATPLSPEPRTRQVGLAEADLPLLLEPLLAALVTAVQDLQERVETLEGAG